jgi:hypothetical protein
MRSSEYASKCVITPPKDQGTVSITHEVPSM